MDTDTDPPDPDPSRGASVKTIIIGGVAGGASAATRLRRLLVRRGESFADLLGALALRL